MNFSSRPSSLEPPKRRRGCAILHPLILITKSRTIVEAQRRTRKDVHLSRKILTRVSSCTSSKHPPPEPLPSTVIGYTRLRHQPAICWLQLQTDYPGSTPIRLWPYFARTHGWKIDITCIFRTVRPNLDPFSYTANTTKLDWLSSSPTFTHLRRFITRRCRSARTTIFKQGCGREAPSAGTRWTAQSAIVKLDSGTRKKCSGQTDHHRSI